jgi:hypothetical protein
MPRYACGGKINAGNYTSKERNSVGGSKTALAVFNSAIAEETVKVL